MLEVMPGRRVQKDGGAATREVRESLSNARKSVSEWVLSFRQDSDGKRMNRSAVLKESMEVTEIMIQRLLTPADWPLQGPMMDHRR